MATKTLLKCAGLHTYSNQLQMPPGALLEALNVFINRDDIIEPRRGFKLYGNSFGTSISRAKQLLVYKDRILRHYGSTLQYDNGSGTFSSFSGSYSETETGLRIKGLEANGNFYFTTSDGIKKISSSSAVNISNTTITNAGGIKALDGEAELNYTSGFFTQDSATAYRILWGIKDANNNLIYGTPSERIVVTNSLLSLLIRDFNSLLVDLDTAAAASSTDLLSDTTYVANLKLSNSSTAAQLVTKLQDSSSGFTKKLDDDFTVTEKVAVSSIEVASNVGILTFAASVADYLAIDDYIQISGFSSGAAADINGYHKITSVSTTVVRFNIAHADAGPVTDTATVKRLKYTIAPFRYNEAATIPVASTSAFVTSQKAYVQFNGSISTYVKVGDSIQISGLTGTGLSVLNGTHIVNGIQKITANDDAIQFTLMTADVGSLGSPVSDTGAQVIVGASDLNLALSTDPTTEQLERIQAFYDDIIDGLYEEPTGLINSSISFAPSYSSTSATVDITFTVPQEATLAHFYQIYRSPLTTSTGTGLFSELAPSEEMNLVYEGNPTSAELSSLSITVNDIVPEDFRTGGAPLYTNPNTGEGMSQANEIPPVAKDVALYKDYMFYANTQTRHRMTVDLLGVTNFNSQSSHIKIGNSSTEFTYSFVKPTAQVVTVTAVAGANYASSGAGDYFDIYSALDGTHYRIWFASGTAAAPSSTGMTLVQVTITGAETAAQAATKIYNALNIYTDFSIPAPSAANVVITNTLEGICTAPSENVTDAGFAVALTTAGNGEDAANYKVEYSDSASLTPSQQVDACARSLVRVINKTATDLVHAYYISGAADVPGKMLLETRSLAGGKFFVVANDSTTGAQFQPDLSPQSITGISLANPTVVTVSAAHNLTTGDQVRIFSSNSTPTINSVYTVTVINSTTFSVPVNVTTPGNTAVLAKESSDNEVKQNRLYYSKYRQPEAVPQLNFIPVGPEDGAIKRIMALRDSLFILKTEGIYRLSGDVAPFSLAPFDFSSVILPPDSAVVLNNQIYFASDQDIVRVTETGVEVISRPIENLLTKIGQYTNYSTATFGVPYESDRSYYLFTLETSADTVAQQCFRFNTFTNTWSILDLSKTCGVVNTADEKLYLGASDTNYIEQERKSFTRTDYADREITKTLSVGSISSDQVRMSSVSDINVGDMIVQSQTVTIAQFNRLLRQLDNDPAVGDTNYLATLEIEPGQDMRQKLTSLAAKLDADSGVNQTDFVTSIAGYGSTFANILSAFNAITAKLNSDTGTFYSNYPTVSGTVDIEIDIIDINLSTKTTTTRYAMPFIAGPILVYNHFDTSVSWAPDALDDSGIFKQVREGTILFETTNFSDAEVAYASDLSPDFEQIEFTSVGNGSFGSSTYGDINTFGGSGTSAPFRTLIPRNKQRCRYMKCRFKHAIARETFAIYGISYTFESYSSKAYK